MLAQKLLFLCCVCLLGVGIFSCKKQTPLVLPQAIDSLAVDSIPDQVKLSPYLYELPISREVRIGGYFDFMDSLVAAYDSLVPYLLTEHLLVRTNYWLIDSLAATDYYRMMDNGQFVYDQKTLVILKMDDTLKVPTLSLASKILRQQARTTIDINIPEFRLRILEGATTRYNFPVRVGQDRTRYLATAGREVDLRTYTGEGSIIKIKRNPSFINPVDGKRFSLTRRDDKKVTIMPLIPWLAPEIEGHYYGQMIHPTTNPVSLGKAYSNGCIGTKESDAWYIYYHAPIGTRVVIRYDLEGVNEAGDTLRWRDIYGWGKKKKLSRTLQ